MNDDDECDFVEQYKSLELRRVEFTKMKTLPPREYGWHLQKFSKFLINHGESLKTNFDLTSPKELAADFAQQALDIADVNDHDLKAAAYLSFTTARWFFPCPPHRENAVLCEEALSEATIWLNSSEGLNSSKTERQHVEQMAYTSRENRALYLHYADDFATAIDEYYSLLEEKRKTGSDKECFTLSMKLANVLNDANRYTAAKQLLFSSNTECLATSDNQRFRLHVAQSHSHALAGQMGAALDDIRSALRYFNSNDIHVETQGNLLIRAARYYIKMSAYEDAMTMLPDLIGSEDNYTGGEYKLNLAVVRAMLWVAYGNQDRAIDTLNKLESMVQEILKKELPEKSPDQYWDYAILKAEFEQRFHGNHAAIAFISRYPEVTNSTIDTLDSSHYPLLLKYCEVSVKAGDTKNLKPQIIALLCGSVFDDQWERWKAPFWAAKWFLLEGQIANAILWSKLSCSYILSLSVPLLNFDKQRERVTEELISPFIFLENALCTDARLPEAQSVRAYRMYLECEMRIPYFSDSAYQAFTGNNIESNFSPEEAAFVKKWTACSKKALKVFEQGKTLIESVKSANMYQVITEIERKCDDDHEQAKYKYSQRLQDQKATNICYLSYWVNDDQVQLVAEYGASRINLILPISPQEMRREIFKLRVAIEEGAEWMPIATHLYSSLITPVEKVLYGADTLSLSVTDALRYLPMATLFDGSHYMIEKFELVYSHTGNIKPTMIQQDASTMFIGTRCHIPGQVKLKPDQELAQIQKQFTVKTALIDQDWNLDHWKQKLTDPHSILHLCCHFNYQPHNPANSYLMLSDKRRLDIEDLLKIDSWEGIDLMFLATCNSALGGEKLTSDAKFSLADIFISAGVKRVVASFRPVSDTETQQFSADFYRQLSKTGSVERSLRLAQCEAIKKDNPVWGAYGCWAP